MTISSALTARRLRNDTERVKRERMLAEKTAPARAAEEAERRARAEQHRLQALPALADELAGIVFDVIERDRVVIRTHLAEALHARLLRSGLHKIRRVPPG